MVGVVGAVIDFDELERMRPRVYARFERNFYGLPFAARDAAGKPLIVIEEESGVPVGRAVSETFFQAWCLEFTADGFEP